MTTATTTIGAKSTKSGSVKKSKLIQVRDIEALVKFLADNNVKRFKHLDLEIEIDTIVNATRRDETPESLDKKAKATASLFQETPEDEEANLFWSAGSAK